MFQSTPFTVLHIPHHSTVIPSDIRPTLLLTDVELALEILTMTDHDTADLFNLGVDARRIIHPVSRLVLDPERFVDDSQEVMASRGVGVIYTQTSTQKALRVVPSADVRQQLIERYYIPHHTTLTNAVDESLVEHGFCLLIDCPSFPAHPLWFDLDQSPARPQICIGTDEFHTPQGLLEFVGHQFQAQGFSVKVNQPYSGTIVPSKHYRVTGSVWSLMIEINRAVYMDEQSGQQLTGFSHFANQLQTILRDVQEYIASRWRR